MTQIDRYVAREFLRLFFLFVMALPLLFIIGDWTDNVGRYSELGLPIRNVALSYFYRLPLFISYSFPVGALIATVFTVSNMTRHSELTAAKAGGLSFFRTLRVLPLLGVLLTFAGLALTEIVPVGMLRSKEVLGQTQPAFADMRHEFVYSGPEGHTFTVRRLMTGGSDTPPALGGVTIERTGSDGRPAEHISARSGKYDAENGGWTLEDGYYRAFIGDENEERSFRFRELRLASFTETPEQLMARSKEPEEMRYAELSDFIDTLERSGGRPLKLMVERAQKVSIPVATFIIILFGAPLANSSPRSGPAYGIGISLGITVVYMMMFRLTGAAGTSGMIDPVHAAWLPNVGVLLAALVLLTRVRT
jgi:lipopolysaccharide export system permease protein